MTVSRTGDGTIDGEAFVPQRVGDFNQHGLTSEQYDILLRPLNSTRVVSRQASGKTLSYLESWEVRAHLSRIFGFANWDLEMLDYVLIGVREYKTKDDKPMLEPMWQARMRLRIRAENGDLLATYTEAAVGSASGPDYLLGELHDNALKTAASDAMKRCAINLGTQFGLSLYDHGNKQDVVKRSLVTPVGYEKKPEPDKDLSGVGVTPTGEATNEGGADPSTTEAQIADGTARDVAREQHS